MKVTQLLKYNYCNRDYYHEPKMQFWFDQWKINAKVVTNESELENNLANRNEKLLEQIELINMKIQGLKDRRQLCNTHVQLYSLPRE